MYMYLYTLYVYHFIKNSKLILMEHVPNEMRDAFKHMLTLAPTLKLNIFVLNNKYYYCTFTTHFLVCPIIFFDKDKIKSM